MTRLVIKHIDHTGLVAMREPVESLLGRRQPLGQDMHRTVLYHDGQDNITQQSRSENGLERLSGHALIHVGQRHDEQQSAPTLCRAAWFALREETTLIAVAGGNVAKGVVLTEEDLARVFTAAGLIWSLLDAWKMPATHSG